MAKISTHIREDVFLDNEVLGTILINNAMALKVLEIRKNLENQYTYLSLQAIIPDFEKYVNQFIEKTSFDYTGGIKYPETGNYGINILDKNRTEYSTGVYSMKAIVPEGYNLKVKISGEHHWMYPAFQDNTGWSKSNWNDEEMGRTLTAARTGEIDFEMMLQYYLSSDEYTFTNQVEILVYENEDVSPTWTKTIDIKEN